MNTPDVRAQAADLIDAAIDVLHERGWCQGELQDDAGRVCLQGALYTAAHRITLPSQHLAGFHSLALSELNTNVGRLTHRFNDDPDTTVEDVLLAMKQAAASLREPQP